MPGGSLPGLEALQLGCVDRFLLRQAQGRIRIDEHLQR